VTPPSALHPELDQRLARIEARVGEMFELLKAWADEAQALRARQLSAERELAEARRVERELSARLARLERGPDTEPAGLEPAAPELVT